MDLIIWSSFLLLVFFFLALDLGVFNRKAHVISTREAFAWTGVWITMALLFNVVIYFIYENHWLTGVGANTSGKDAVILFFTGYLVEEALSIDNIFVISLILSYFKVPSLYQHRILFWGILGALFFRGVMIGIGAALIQNFTWITYVFGVFLIYSAIKMLRSNESDFHPEESVLVKFIKRIWPVSKDMESGRFFIRLPDGRRAVTMLFVVLIVVESADIVFAVDSIPAIFAITQDPFIVFTSNVFAILGLRSLYFVLASVIDKFRYLKQSLTFILGYIGVKMLVANVCHIPVIISLAVIVISFALGIIASILVAKHDAKKTAA